MEFRGQLWLQLSQIWLQSSLFGLWLLALGLSVATLWRPRSPRFHRLTRAIWLSAMIGFLALWVGGATLEMMRRTAPISWRGLVVALGAFSLLMAGVLSLARECFDSKRSLIPGRIVLTLLALTLAGCFFGGFALPFNTLFAAGNSSFGADALPKGWILALCGAQLLTVAHTLKPGSEPKATMPSPREATIWLGGCLTILACWHFEDNGLVVLTAYVGFIPFLIRTWSAHLQWKRRGETTVWIAASLVFIGLVLAFRASLPADQAFLIASWRIWPHVTACLVLAILLVMIWRMPVSFSLRLATQDSVALQALLLGVSLGALPAIGFFGPSAGIWWGFWPIAGLFFDLLQVDDDHERKWRQLSALKQRLKNQRGDTTRTESILENSADSTCADRADEEPAELSAVGRSIENR